ncbi:zinc metalloprotease HtpX [Mesorhizobium sp. 1B3]|uniref:zinc metalloprotease HtpX n=1 Tax=Mesorhizobium sp. 1B3 TaxID=3243599 RepID=UPI003D977FF8
MNHAPTIDLLAQRHNRVQNTLHTWLLGAASLLLLAVTAWAFAGPIGIAYAAVFGILPLIFLRRISPQMVLSMYKASRVSPTDFPTGYRLIEELARRAALPAAPKLYVIPSRMVNAFAVGRRGNSAIAVTDALARMLTTRELAGVLAHEISHVAHEDVKVMAFADIVSRITSLMSTIGLFSLFLNLAGFAGGYDTQIPWLGVIVLLAAPTIGGLLQMALSRTREFDADLGAAMLTGDPEGLAMALKKLERAQGKMWEGILLPGSRMPDPSILRSHPRTEDRIERLLALKAEPIDGLRSEFGDGRPVLRRHSTVPRIRPQAPHGVFAGHLLLEAVETEADRLPACAHPLNPPRNGPRIRPLRGGVWW